MATLADYVMGAPNDVTTADLIGAIPKDRGFFNKLAQYAASLERPYFGGNTPLDYVQGFGNPLVGKFLNNAVAGTINMGASGVDNMQRGYDEGDPLRAAGGAGQAVLASLPMMRGAGALYSTLPRATMTTGVTTGAATIPLAISDAQAADRARASTVTPPDHLSQELSGLRQGYEEAQRRYDAANDPKRNYPSKDARRLAVEPLAAELSTYRDKIAAAETRIRDAMQSELARMKAEAPFRERYPGAAEAIFSGGALLAGGIPFANTLKNRLGEAAEGFLINRQARNVGDMLRTGRNDARAVDGQRALQTRVNEFDGTAVDRYVSPAIKHLGGAALSASTMAEASSLPEQIDYIAFGPGHPTREAAADAFTKPGYYAERIGPLLMGAGLYGMGVKAGNTITPTPTYNRNLVDDVLNYGNADHLKRLQDLRQFRDDARAVRRPPPDDPSSGPSAGPGPGPLPPPSAGPSARPNLPQTPERIPNSTTRPSYGPQEQAVARPHIASEVAAGRNVPTVEELSTYLAGQGLNKPLPANIAPKVDALTNLVHELRGSGMSNDQISNVIARLMASGRNNLPAIATGTALGLGAMNQGRDAAN